MMEKSNKTLIPLYEKKVQYFQITENLIFLPV